MAFALAAVQLFSIVLWVGSLCFFAFIVAPVAFRELGDRHAAGLMVGSALRLLHQLGLVSGTLFVLATAVTSLRELGRRRVAVFEITLVAFMLVLTAFSQFSIIPRMDRARPGKEDSIGPNSTEPGAVFMALHSESERVEGSVLLLGFGVCALLSSRLAKQGRAR